MSMLSIYAQIEGEFYKISKNWNVIQNKGRLENCHKSKETKEIGCLNVVVPWAEP
jgi:hypothetical protein